MFSSLNSINATKIPDKIPDSMWTLKPFLIWGHSDLRHDGPAVSPAASVLAGDGPKKRAALIAKLKTRGGTWWTLAGHFLGWNLFSDRPTGGHERTNQPPEMSFLLSKFNGNPTGKRHLFGGIPPESFLEFHVTHLKKTLDGESSVAGFFGSTILFTEYMATYSFADMAPSTEVTGNVPLASFLQAGPFKPDRGFAFRCFLRSWLLMITLWNMIWGVHCIYIYMYTYAYI